MLEQKEGGGPRSKRSKMVGLGLGLGLGLANLFVGPAIVPRG